MMALSAASDLGSWSHMASSARSGVRFAGIVASVSIIRAMRCGAFWINVAMAAASGMFRQYFFGISARMAFGFTRAGLKMLS